ncbi:hypothetical protein SAMN05428966_10275 [Massilia sp. PDC64]|nr:hypothetical protein [Massilia sp. PDC64]SDC66816.1 hypothetical protein SAMN05428966_10275 [Massilia sp. PDC64]
MSRPKKPRNKAYRPKGACDNPLGIFGGMGDTHRDHLRRIQTLNHLAMVDLAQGRGTREQWNRIVGAINIANVMCEMGIGDEFRQATIDARDALLELGKRAVRNDDHFVCTGAELTAINHALDCHDAQLENVRAIDVDRAADEVARRVRHRINSTSVMREIRREAA